VGSAVSEIGFGGVKTDSAGADWVAKLERTRFGGIIGRFGCQSIGSGCSGSTITAGQLRSLGCVAVGVVVIILPWLQTPE
jgi:hypothetical protein